ncbi:MAG: CBS domain-containing protein, partial [Desulfobacterales bacterium]|nr:CBS domain-containing protein [Desulfobacterales bacterium]
MKVNDILAVKGRRVVTIVASTSIFDAMLVFAANRIGSLLVIDKNENILGIIC